MNHSFAFQLNQLLDHYDNQHRTLECTVNGLPRDAALTNPELYRTTHQLAHEQAAALAEVIDPDNTQEAAEILHHHPIHSQVLLQSAFIRHAYLRPYGYPGDKDLMLMICNQQDAGESNYAILQNRVYLNLPAAEAVRQRVQSMAHLLGSLPEQSKVLNLACGPALEVSQCFRQHPGRQLFFDLVDHDPHTICHTQTTILQPEVRHLLGNALHLAHGFRDVGLAKAVDAGAPTTPPQTEETWLANESYDLVYSMGLYDYLAHHPGHQASGTIGLTRTLFDLVKPGGRLVIGNFLEQAPLNTHTFPHRLMMELYSNWQLRYRSHTEMLGFLEAVAPDRYQVSLTNEYFEDQPLSRGVIGFLIVTKCT